MYLAYYQDCLHDYLEVHGFEFTQQAIEIVYSNSQLAFDTFKSELKNGRNRLQAHELAMIVLHTGIGESKVECITDFLEIEFKDRTEVLNSIDFNSLVYSIAEEWIWDEFEIETGLGLDRDKIKCKQRHILDFINQYLIDYGIQ